MPLYCFNLLCPEQYCVYVQARYTVCTRCMCTFAYYIHLYMLYVCVLHNLYILYVRFVYVVHVLHLLQIVHECSVKIFCTCCKCTVHIVSCTIFYAVFVQVVCTVYTVCTHSMCSVVAVYCGWRQPGSLGCVPAQGHAPTPQEPGRTVSGHTLTVPLS